MSVWRLLAYFVFILAIILSIISFLQQSFSLFLWALCCYFLSTIILYTLKKLYQEPFQPNRTNYRKQRDSWWWDFLEDSVSWLDSLIELPIVLFRFLLYALKFINPFD